MVTTILTGVVFYTKADLADPPAQARQVLALFGFNHAASIYLLTEAINQLLPPTPEELEAVRQDALEGDVPLDPEALTMQGLPGFEFLGEKVPAGQIGRFWTPGGCLYISLPFSSGLVTPFAQAVDAAIPPEVRGHCSLWPESFEIGPQRAIAFDDRGRPVFTTDMSFAFGLHPRESPFRKRDYAAMVLQVPAVIDLKRRLETVVGPLEAFAHWPGM